jgi:tetratricopeptide (TPR) repeat protein
MRKTLLTLAAIAWALPGVARAVDEASLPATGAPQLSGRALDVAIAGYRAQLATNPKDPIAHNKLGVCYQQANKLKPARKEYQKAVELDPRYAEAWNNLGTLEHGAGKYKKALDHYRKAVALKPDRATFHRNVGAAWLASGNLARAIEAYGEALRLDPAIFTSTESAGFVVAGVDQGQLYFTYAKLFARGGDLESAFVWLTRARERGFRDFRKVAADPDFSEVVADPRYAELAR